MTRPPRLKAKPMAGRRGDAEKRRDGETEIRSTAGSRQIAAPRQARDRRAENN
jgi:hypothetical protein